jgi:N utilization substance protein B
VKKIYAELTETDKYKEYITQQSREKAKEKEIIKLIFTQLMLPNESFIGHLEELFNNWDDDADMMDQLMLNYIQKPGSYNLQEMLSPEKWEFRRNITFYYAR